MGVLSGLVLLLFSLVGYSSGAVIGGRGRQVSPKLSDFGAMVVIWVIAIISRSLFGRWTAIVIYLIIAGVVSAVFTKLRIEGYENKKGNIPVQSAGGLLRKAWESWKVFAAEMGNYQGRMLLGFFYFTVVAPFGIGVRIFGDPLAIKRTGGKSFWAKRELENPNIETAHQQF